MQTFDFSPLTTPVDKSSVAELRRESISEKVQPAAIDDVFVFWMCLVTFVFDTAVVVFIDTGSLAPWVKVGIAVILGPMALFLLYGIFSSIYRLRVRWSQFFRANQFATVNRMTYAVSESRPTWDSLLFNGYAVIDVGRPVPLLMLRSTGRRSAKRWALGAYSRNPILSLGFSADRRFRLYCTAGAEDEARRIFTPELIAALNRVERSRCRGVGAFHVRVLDTAVPVSASRRGHRGVLIDLLGGFAGAYHLKNG